MFGHFHLHKQRIFLCLVFHPSNNESSTGTYTPVPGCLGCLARSQLRFFRRLLTSCDSRILSRRPSVSARNPHVKPQSPAIGRQHTTYQNTLLSVELCSNPYHLNRGKFPLIVTANPLHSRCASRRANPRSRRQPSAAGKPLWKDDLSCNSFCFQNLRILPFSNRMKPFALYTRSHWGEVVYPPRADAPQARLSS